MRARIACGVVAIALAGAAVACAPARDEGATADSASVQAGPAVAPVAGATAAAPIPDTAGRTTGATSSSAPAATRPSTPRPATPSTSPKDRGADTLEYDRAIDFKPGPGKELPAVDTTKKRKP